MPARLVVLLSGAGSLLQALADSQGSDFEIVAVISDDPRAAGLVRAAEQGIPALVVDPASYGDRQDWDSALADTLGEWQPDWIVCAGFMRILGSAVLDRFPGRVVNTHPALLPSFPGAHGVRDALAYGVRVTGCTVHLVDAGVDTGPVLAQVPVPVEEDDDVDSLHERIKQAERRLLPDVISRLSTQGVTIQGRRATIP